MSNVCVLVPTVRGKRSALYEGIYRATGKDRKLSNFLYALSLQESIRKKFDSKDFNSQGEPKTKAFLDKFDVKSMVSDKQRLAAERRDIGATDDSDKPIGYNYPEDVYQKVVDYNNSHDRFKALIRYRDGKFYIELDTLNADNYGANRTLERRKAIYDAMMNYLASHGFNTNFSTSVRVNTANFLNAFGLRTNLLNLIKFNSTNGKYTYSPRLASFLIDLFEGDPMVERLKSQFGDETADVISRVSQELTNTAVTTQLSPETLDKLDVYWRGKVEAFLASARNRIIQLNTVDLTTATDHAEEQAEHSTDYFGVSSSDIYTTLKELYSTYHLDKETLDSVDESIKTLSEAANRFLKIRVKQLELKRAKEGFKRGDDGNLKAIQDEIRSGQYAQSIVSFLGGVMDTLTQQRMDTEAIQQEFQASPSSLEAINRLSASIMSILDSVSAYNDILERLSNLDNLEIDQIGAPPELLSEIKVAARAAKQALDDNKNYARDKQFDAVYAFLKLYWGNSDIKEFNGENYSLETILRVAQKDVNMLDRFIYSMNESNDEALTLIYEAVKSRNRARDAVLRRGQYIIRTLTDDLYKSSDSSFMFMRDDKNIPTGMLISNVDYKKFEEDKEAYRKKLEDDNSISPEEADKKLDAWIHRNTKTVNAFNNQIFKNALEEYTKALYGESANPDNFTYKITIPDPAQYGTHTLDNLTSAQREYYYRMMALKMILSSNVPNAEQHFFDAIQISADFTTALGEAGGNPTRVLQMVKNMVTDAIQHREDDTDYGETFSDVLETNGMKKVLSDLNGHELMKLPLFFTHNLKDKTRLSTDFSRGMMAMMASVTQYNEMNKVIDALMLSKDWLLSRRKTQKTAGSKVLTDIFTWGRDMYINSVSNDTGASKSAGLLMDFYEKDVFGRRKKDEGTVTLFGVKVSVDKAADILTRYTSITGLTVNLLGAQANALVGKLQMIIEGGAGEFYNLKDLAVADFKYGQMLPELLLELNSNNKSSKLGLLMERFDVLEGYYDKLKSAGFYRSPIGKIIGNSNLLFMYGMGEHLLHAETMLAVLHATKVHDSQTNRDIPLLNAITVDKHGHNGKLSIDKSRYKWITKDADGNPSYSEITDNNITTVEKRITYCNKTMQGAFSELDKGMIHRYAAGRLIMNFRQWMPAHYGRRFRGLHYDADLGEFRRGYYVSLFDFLSDCVRDLKDKKFQIATHWEELSEMDKYNMKRIVSELTVFALLTVSNLSLGKYKDKKGNWAYRNLMYQVKRMLMETQASSPIIMPFSGYGATGFVKNIITTLNSPVASLSSVDKLASIIDFTNLFEEVQSGKHKGENLYWHKFHMNIPFYGQLEKQINMADEDYVFNVFTQNGQN